jgi:hypothetical protein
MTRLEDCPQSEVDELRQAIKEDWDDEERRAYWTWRIQDEGEFSRELKQMGRECVARIRAQARMEGQQ